MLLIFGLKGCFFYHRKSKPNLIDIFSKTIKNATFPTDFYTVSHILYKVENRYKQKMVCSEISEKTIKKLDFESLFVSFYFKPI